MRMHAYLVVYMYLAHIISLGVALLEDVGFVEWVWPHWRKYVIVGVDFEVFYAQGNTQCLSQLSVTCKIYDSQLQYYFCLYAFMFPTMIIMNWSSETIHESMNHTN